MGYPQQCTDLHCHESDRELFAIALALRHIRALIQHSGSDMRRPDLESALHSEHLEFVLAHAVEIPWKDTRLTQEWRKLQQVLSRVREAWENGQSLFQEALGRAERDQKSMAYFSMIDFAVNCYAEVAASRAYPDQPALWVWSVNGCMVAWRRHSLETDEVEGESMD